MMKTYNYNFIYSLLRGTKVDEVEYLLTVYYRHIPGRPATMIDPEDPEDFEVVSIQFGKKEFDVSEGEYETILIAATEDFHNIGS